VRAKGSRWRVLWNSHRESASAAAAQREAGSVCVVEIPERESATARRRGIRGIAVVRRGWAGHGWAQNVHRVRRGSGPWRAWVLTVTRGTQLAAIADWLSHCSKCVDTGVGAG